MKYVLISTIKNSMTHNHGLRTALTPQENTADVRTPQIHAEYGGVGQSELKFSLLGVGFGL